MLDSLCYGAPSFSLARVVGLDTDLSARIGLDTDLALLGVVSSGWLKSYTVVYRMSYNAILGVDTEATFRVRCKCENTVYYVIVRG